MLFRIKIILLLLFGIAPCIMGQQKNIDSLLIVLQNYKKEDTAKVKLQTNIAILYLEINPQFSVQFGKDAFLLASNLNANNIISASLEAVQSGYQRQSKTDSGLIYNKIELELVRKHKNRKQESVAVLYLY